MRGKKVLTVLVVIAMIAATMIVLDIVLNTNPAGAVQVTPGYNYWQGNNTDSAFNKRILNNSDDTASLYYNNIETLEINGSLISETCSLYYPDYNVYEDTGSGNYEVYCNWTRYSGVSITPTSLNHEVTLHRAGLWLIVPNSASKLWHVDMNNMTVADPVASSNYEDIIGWFWVNASEWAVTLWLSLANTALAFVLWNHALKRMRAFELSVLQNTMLIQIGILAWIFLGEELTATKVMAMIMVFIGVLIVQIVKKPERSSESY